MDYSYLWRLDQFQAAGQNLEMSMTTGQAQVSPQEIVQLITSWFNEQKNGRYYGWMSLINSFNPGNSL